jgi:hypothetical protein
MEEEDDDLYGTGTSPAPPKAAANGDAEGDEKMDEELEEGEEEEEDEEEEDSESVWIYSGSNTNASLMLHTGY